MNLYLGVTDTNWYTYLSANNPEDVNFWRPGGGYLRWHNEHVYRA